ncbi:MAG TPA: MarR family transcriptional regulator [Xanthomonadaceae bacterium]|nr:MarR family transcriptional regulator [Xanthomonadaceae bacterium]
MEDVVKALGHLTLGTRLRRLGERLQAQTQAVLTEHGIDVPASHLPLLAALDRHGSLNVGGLTQALGVSQPAVTRLIGKLESDGMVRTLQAAGDLRVRNIELTRAGQALVATAKRTIWPSIDAAVREACTGATGSLLAGLAALEVALASAPLATRVKNPGTRRASA